MKIFLQYLLASSIAMLSTTVIANAADATVTVYNSSNYTLTLDARHCQNCTSSIPSTLGRGATVTTTMNLDATATWAVFSFGYAAKTGSTSLKKGCTISLSVSGDGNGNLTGVTNGTMTPYTTDGTTSVCKYTTPQYDPPTATWSTNVYIK